MANVRRNHGRLLLWGTTLAVALTATAQAAQPPKDDPKTPAKTVTEPVAVKPAEKTIAFEMRQVPWPKVFEWLSDQTGLPVITNNLVVTDTFNFISPRIGKEPRKYTFPEVIDLINEGLLRQKFVLIRRETTFMLIPADEKVDPALLPRIRVEDLNQRGNTEIVTLVLQLNTLVAEDFASEVKKMMGPFGEVVPLTRPNQLLMQDAAGNLRRVIETIKKIEENEKGQADTFSHKCLYVRASAAAATLKELLGDAKQLIEVTKPGGPPPGPFGGPPQPRPPVTITKMRLHFITSDDRTNTVHVSGPADKIAQAKAILTKLDAPQQGQSQIAIGPPLLQTYPVPAGNADALAKTLQEIYKTNPTLRISAIGTTQIMVYAGPEDQIEIAKHIQGVRPSGGETALIPLSMLEPARAVDILKGMFGDAKSGAPYVDVHAGQNAIIVKGTAEQLREVRTVLKAIDGEPGALPGSMRIITLEKGSAATLAEALQTLLRQMRPNPVKVILPGSIEPKLEEPKKKAPTLSPISFETSAVQLVDPQKDKKADLPPGDKSKAPISITAFGNKLIVSTDDPQAMMLIQDLVRLLTQTPAGEGDFEVIRLRNANAVDAAKILDEAFNGPKSTGGQGGRGGRDGPGGPGGMPGMPGLPFGQITGMMERFAGVMGGSQRVERIRVVADPATNSLLVKASPLDMLTIRNLLAKALDTVEVDARVLIRTYMVGPLKHAHATDVATVIRDVFRESMNSNILIGRGSGSMLGGFGRMPTQNTDSQGNPRGVSLSVGIDERSNSLVLACPEMMFEDIKKLVDHLDKAAADTTQMVKVVPIVGIDPQLVQQAIDAIQGRRPTTSTNRFGSGGSGFSPFGGGGSGFSPFGGSGFMPGGGGGSGFSPFRSPFGGFSPGGLSPGGFSPGGRGSRFGPGSSRRGDDGPQSRGPDFFAQRVTDDPQPILFDPQQDNLTVPVHAPVNDVQPLGAIADDLLPQTRISAKIHGIQQVSAQQEQKPPMPLGKDKDITAPRLPVTAEALEELGLLILRANNPADLEAALRIIEYIQKEGAKAQVDIQIVSLKHADATSVISILNQLLSRVYIGPTSTTAIPAQPGGQQRFPFGQQQQQAPAAQAAGPIVLIPLPRQNAILFAGPKSRSEDIMKEIHRLDLPTTVDAKATAFALKRAPASRVATLINSFWTDRYPNESRTQNQIRVTYDDSSNTVFVQAGPADLAEIRALVERIDTTVSSAVNDLRIIRLNNALADELSMIILRSIAEGIIAPTTGAGLGQQLGGLGQPGLGGQLGGPGGLGQPGLGGQLGGLTGQMGLGGQTGAGQTRQNKAMSLRFFAKNKDGKSVLEAGILDDIRITPDARTNSLVISAPEKTMQLILALVKEMDVPPTARAEISIFTLKKADATQLAQMLQQLFLGSAAGTTGGARTGVPGAGGFPGLGGAGTTQLGTTGTIRPLQLTLGATTPEGAPLIDLRVTIDERTNSLLVAGSRNDLQIIEALISRLEDSDIQQRHNEAIRLKNAQAVDVANALNDFLTKSLNVYQKGNQLTAFQEIQRDVIIAAEPISNTLLVSATPTYYPDIMRLITQLDSLPPQVVIQVLVAEVDLNKSQEFGVEIGLQSPVLFQRSIIPANGFFGTGTVNYQAPTTGASMLPQGVTVNSTINPAAQPGFNFNNPLLPLGNNPVVGPNVIGLQGLGSLGTGRVSPTNNIGGFVFSAASDSFNVLIRALKIQGRIDILSRPQIMTLDNQTALINVGQEIPIVTSSNVTATGVITTNIERKNVGVILQVTPKINPDGRVVMRVVPEISSDAGQVSVGQGMTSTVLNIQHLETTVSAYDGETVALGGLITKRDTVTDNKIPCLGDLPVLGALFRYRSQTHTKTELLIIMTPHIVYSSGDVERILYEERKRIDWVTSDVNKIYGPIPTTPRAGPGASNPLMTPPVEMLPGKGVIPEQGPAPRSLTLPEPTSQRPVESGIKTASAQGVPQIERPAAPVQNMQAPATPPPPVAETRPQQRAVNQGRENRQWRLFP